MVSGITESLPSIPRYSKPGIPDFGFWNPDYLAWEVPNGANCMGRNLGQWSGMEVPNATFPDETKHGISLMTRQLIHQIRVIACEQGNQTLK